MTDSRDAALRTGDRVQEGGATDQAVPRPVLKYPTCRCFLRGERVQREPARAGQVEVGAPKYRSPAKSCHHLIEVVESARGARLQPTGCG